MSRADLPPTPAPPKLPMVMLGLMTVATFAGPFLILLTLRGGPRPDWPPDRPVEWGVFVAVCALVVLLMAACLTVGLWSRPKPPPAGR
jgi:hypothetical protein